MKKTFLLILVALFSVGSAWSKAPQDELKVLSWNVWHEGHHKAYGDKGCQGTIGILRASGADVVIMVETYGASKMVAEALGFNYKLISSNLSIYSRYPIAESYSFPGKIDPFNFGGVMIDVNGTKVRVFATWLHYLPDARLVPTDKSEKEILEWEATGTRTKEITAILSVIEPFLAQTDSIPIIMGGDFNIHSHLDWTKKCKDMYQHGGAVVRWPMSVAMEKAGFTDSFREANPDPAKNLGVTWLQPEPLATLNREDRIDYIYYKGDGVKLLGSDIHDRELGETLSIGGSEYFYASDHGFVLSTFKVK